MAGQNIVTLNQGASGSGRLVASNQQVGFSAVEARDRKGRLDVAELQKRALPFTPKQQQLIMSELERFHLGKDPWDIWNTPLDTYTMPLLPMLNGKEVGFKTYLEAKAGKEEYKLLVLGVGEGIWWEHFLKRHPNIEFLAVTLNKMFVAPGLQDMTVMCGADAIEKVFPLGYFDMITTRHGIHDDEIPAIVATNKLLKVGGEALVVGNYFHFSMPETSLPILRACPSFEVLGERKEGASAAFHLLKRE